MADPYGVCERCGREVSGGVRVVSTDLGDAFAVLLIADPDRDWICCDICNTLVCHNCCEHPESGFCDTCYRRVFRRQRRRRTSR